MASLWRDFLEAPDYFEGSPWFPNPLICVRDMAITGVRETTERLPWNGVEDWLNGTWHWITRANYDDPAAIILPILLAIFFTLLRLFLTWTVYNPIAKWSRLTPDAADKFPESIWKASFYSVTWVWGLYLLFAGRTNSFFNLRSHWDSWSPDMTLTPSQYWLYMIQMGFYLHCSYATMYLETIRKDFAIMMSHHVLTLGLLLFSYWIRFHMIGLILLSMFDIGDILLEFSKAVFYFKDRNGKNNPGAELIANVCFGLFTIQHVLCRLYWYPTKVIYSAMHISVIIFPDGPYWLLFNPMLWGLFAMQVYWFKFIVRLLWKILVLGQKLEDNRETPDEATATAKVNGKKHD